MRPNSPAQARDQNKGHVPLFCALSLSVPRSLLYLIAARKTGLPSAALHHEDRAVPVPLMTQNPSAIELLWGRSTCQGLG